MLQTKDYRIILGSKSPRRRELLTHLIPDFDIRTKEIEELYPETLPAEEVPEYLAKLKASAFIDNLDDKEVLITSDTIVTLEGRIYEKPKDEDDAIRILREISGKTHEVITGVCLQNKSSQRSFCVHTKVRFKPLSMDEIIYYIQTFKPYDKAGAYAIQEWMGMIGIESIEGDYFNVVGLPIFRLNQELSAFIKTLD